MILILSDESSLSFLSTNGFDITYNQAINNFLKLQKFRAAKNKNKVFSFFFC